MVEQPTETPMVEQPIELHMGEQLTEPQLVEYAPEQQLVDDSTELPVRVKLRKGQYIVTFDKRKAGSIDLTFDVDKCLQQKVFNALRKNAVHRPKKPRKLDTVANLTPEQLERKRASRREYYYNHKEQFKAYVRERYNSDPVYWEKKLALSKERYHRLRDNVEKRSLVGSQKLKTTHHQLPLQMKKQKKSNLLTRSLKGKMAGHAK